MILFCNLSISALPVGKLPEPYLTASKRSTLVSKTVVFFDLLLLSPLFSFLWAKSLLLVSRNLKQCLSSTYWVLWGNTNKYKPQSLTSNGLQSTSKTNTGNRTKCNQKRNFVLLNWNKYLGACHLESSVLYPQGNLNSWRERHIHEIKSESKEEQREELRESLWAVIVRENFMIGELEQGFKELWDQS